MSGTEVTCRDVDTKFSATRVIENDYMVITDGNRYIDGLVVHANGTHIITVKVRK